MGAAAAALLSLSAVATTADATAVPDKEGTLVEGPIIEGPPPPGFPSWEEVFALQDRMGLAADQITDVDANATEAGLGGIVLSADTRAMTVYWTGGTVPGPVADLLDPLREAGVTVQVKPAAYPRRTLLEAEKTLVDRLVAEGQNAGVTAVGPSSDGSGLSVRVSGSEEEARAVPAIRDTKVTVKIRAGAQMHEATATRVSDSPPFWGGAQVVNGTRVASMGFAVRDTFSGLAMMVTRAHGLTYGTVKTPAGDNIGNVMGIYPDNDVAIINANSGGRVYWGPWNLPITRYKPVFGHRKNHDGDIVCNDGAFTGAWCGLLNRPMKVTDHDETIYFHDHWVHNEVEVEYEAAASGEGDSGGPVVTQAADRTGVYMKGTMSAFDPSGTPACVGDTSHNRKCGKTFWYQDAARIVSMFGPVVTATS